jgi:geranylgeranyl diphosphate synthase type I
MLAYLEEKKKFIERFLDRYMAEYADDLGRIGPEGKDVCLRLLDFVKKGKMLRGVLVQVSRTLFSDPRSFDESAPPSDDCVRLGGALELFQSALLVHDDIMDRDVKRRGEDSFFYRYVKRAESDRLSDPYHIGESLGICAGDVGFFLGFDLVSRCGLTPADRSRVLSRCANELAFVGVAQMFDVLRGASRDHSEVDSVLTLYRFKTGRYTFSLPLALGAIAAHAPDDAVATLDEIGELLGLVFQIKDDEIGLFGDEKRIGKPVGSDVREGKKTLFTYYLFNQMDPVDAAVVRGIFGNHDATLDQVEIVRGLVERYGIRTLVDQRVEEYSCIARDKLAKLDVPCAAAKRRLEEIVEYNLSRNT